MFLVYFIIKSFNALDHLYGRFLFLQHRLNQLHHSKTNYHNKQYYCPRENLTLNIQNWLEANAQSHRQDKTDPIYRAVKLG